MILIFNRKLSFVRIEVFYMKIIMRRVSVIFYSENHGNDNAVRRCLLDKIKNAYRLNSASHNILKKSVLLDS